MSSSGTVGGLVDSFFHQYGQRSESSTDPAWLVQAPDQRSDADTWQVAIESGLDVRDASRSDAPAAY